MPTPSTLWVSVTAGELVPSEAVLVRAQTRIWFELRGPMLAPLPCASSAALLLRKYSVPPALLSWVPPGGAWAGARVKPELPLSSPWVCRETRSCG